MEYDPSYTKPQSPADPAPQQRSSGETWQRIRLSVADGASAAAVAASNATNSVKQSLGDVVLMAQAAGMMEFDSFSNRNGAFAQGVEICKAAALDPALDGEMIGTWLLTEIDHWDHEREKLLFITENSLLIVKFDFIALKIKDIRRVFLHMIAQIIVGPLTYPANSFMRTRDQGGVRVLWGDPNNLSFGQKWNPSARDIPYTTFAHHKLIYNEKERETVTFNVDDFYASLKAGVTQALKNKNPTVQLSVQEQQPILIQSYASLTSLVYNQSHLGYNRDRNGVAF